MAVPSPVASAARTPDEVDVIKASNAVILHRVGGEDVLGLLSEAGIAGEIVTDPAGDPLVRGVHEGAPFLVLFFDCERDAGCAALQFRGYVPLQEGVGSDMLDAWNRSRRGGRAWFDSEGDPTLAWGVRLHGGVTPGHLRQERDGFLSAYAMFRQLLLVMPASR